MAKPAINLTGKKLATLTAIEPTGEVDRHRSRLWRFGCDACGRDDIIRSAGAFERGTSCDCTPRKHAGRHKAAIRAKLPHGAPKRWITVKDAARSRHVGEESIWSLIENDEAASKLPAALRGPSVVVDPKALDRLLALDDEPLADDGAPLITLLEECAKAKEFEKFGEDFPDYVTVFGKWLAWDPHPALEHKIRSWYESHEFQFGKRGKRKPHVRRIRSLVVSRSDLHTCIKAFLKPLHHRFPGMPGVFIADGIFQRDLQPDESTKKLYDDRPYAAAQGLWGPARRGTGHADRGILGSPTNRKRMGKPLVVVWPGSHNRWRREVFAEESYAAVAEWRSGELKDGQWLTGQTGKVWRTQGS